MSRFTETVMEDTPRLTVAFRAKEGGGLDLGFKMTPGLSFMDLVGYIGKVQAALYTTAKYQLITFHECPDQALVIAYYPAAKRFDWYAHIDTPMDAMCGMLEIIKQTLVEACRLQNAQQQQSPILGPDMKPYRRQVQ